MNVLVLFEFSGIVRDAFRARGHNAWSVDLSPCLRSNAYHWRGDATVMGCVADPTLRQQWDLIIAHPPCTRLTNAGVRWLYKNGKGTVIDRMKWSEMESYAQLFRWVLNLQIGNVRLAVENPVMHSHATEIIGRPYSQIIQPFQFGHGEIKKTCLWLFGLPHLKPTKIVEGRKPRVHHESPGLKGGLTRSQRRSITYQGIADAMAKQWGG